MSDEPQRLTALVQPIVTAHGFDLDDLTVRESAGTTEVVLIVDRDGGAGLDPLTELSREVSNVLDADASYSDGEYTLEVTTPGIDRPLTQPRHWRRAHGRKVVVERAVEGAAADHITGRIGVLTDDVVDIVENRRGRFVIHQIPLSEVVKAVVQVDFSPPNSTELAKCGLTADAIEARTDAARNASDLSADTANTHEDN